ncbi:hypothetical protein Tco_0811579 [Tanacetum coccineum]
MQGGGCCGGFVYNGGQVGDKAKLGGQGGDGATCQVVKFVFHFLDFSSRAILIGQEPFQFGPGDPVGLFYPNRLGVCIPPGQGVIGTDIQEKDEKQSQKRPNQARDGKDKVKSKPKSVKVKK